MRAIFFGDAHVRARTVEVERLSDFLWGVCRQYNMAFLMGDIFEFFYGGVTDRHPLLMPLMERMKALVSEGIKIFFLEGNHEFRLSGEKDGVVFARQLEVELDGMKVFLSHGDGVDNSPLKRILSSYPFARLAYLLGPTLSFRIAMAARLFLSRRRRISDERISSRLREYAIGLSSGYDVVILAHSHKKERCELKDGRLYLNTGDFTREFDYLIYESGSGFRFMQFRDRGGDV